MRPLSLFACLALAAAAPLVVSATWAPAPAPAVPAAALGSWSVDPVHSHIGFKTEHLGVSHAHGRFNAFSGTIVMADDPADSSVSIQIDAASIDSNNASRDEHLQGPDFFNVVQHPEITFESTKVTRRGEAFVVTGEMTLLGKKKPVTAEIELVGTTEHPRFGKVAGFSGGFTFKRSDFGMNYGVENGMLGDEVQVEIAFETKAQ